MNKTWDDPFSWGAGCSGIKNCSPVGGGFPFFSYVVPGARGRGVLVDAWGVYHGPVPYLIMNTWGNEKVGKLDFDVFEKCSGKVRRNYVFFICCSWIKGLWRFCRRLRRLPWTSPVSDKEYVRKWKRGKIGCSQFLENVRKKSSRNFGVHVGVRHVFVGRYGIGVSIDGQVPTISTQR